MKSWRLTKTIFVVSIENKIIENIQSALAAKEIMKSTNRRPFKMISQWTLNVVEEKYLSLILEPDPEVWYTRTCHNTVYLLSQKWKTECIQKPLPALISILIQNSETEYTSASFNTFWKPIINEFHFYVYRTRGYFIRIIKWISMYKIRCIVLKFH